MARGFAGMDPEARRAIASRGGKNAHAMGRAHAWTSAEAKSAGSKGGKASADRRRCRYCGLVIPQRKGGGLEERACVARAQTPEAVATCEVKDHA